MIISEIYFLCSNGDPIIQQKYRKSPSDSVDLFMNKIKKSDGVFTPHFDSDGRHFFCIKRQAIYIVATTAHETSPIMVIELLSRIYQLCKDFCGTVTEESLQVNIVLVLEVLDEILNNGYVQISSTEKLKPYIQSEPVPMKSPENMAPGLFGIEHRVAPSDASNKPVIRSRWEKEQRKNEIFLDVIERMATLVAANGTLIRCEINGQINMKSFLVGSPDIKLGLNEDITVGQTEQNKGYGNMVNFDTLSFHECVNATEFDSNKILTIRPPEGEFQVINYTLRGDTTQGLPFRVFSYIKDTESARDLELGLKLRCEIPANSHAVNIKVNVPVPASTISVSQQLSGIGQNVNFIAAEKKLVWSVKKMFGKTEVSANLTLINAKEKSSSQKELGPIALDFEVSGFVCSSLQIRFLRVFDREHSYVPFRWVRYITTSDSYVIKIAN